MFIDSYRNSVTKRNWELQITDIIVLEASEHLHNDILDEDIDPRFQLVYSKPNMICLNIY